MPADIETDATRTALKALDTTSVKLHSYGTHRRRRRPNGNLRVGGWDYAAQITANMQEGLLFKAGGVISDNGAWVHQLEGEPHIGMWAQ
ncbi:hypothetical protein [Shinella sp. WSJ-2]|uniref:hypothetical protein n=1 Tax=Shinella sp. WSJ-2 TaxID=2303749 RepID=UPI0011C19B74|nr:hypothetical protein [Shinella sp. WSJ-2]